MELKAKGVFVQRGDHQPLNVGSSSSSEPHLAIHSPPAALSKWPPFCAPRRVEEPDRARFASPGAAPRTSCLLSLAWTRAEEFSVAQFWIRLVVGRSHVTMNEDAHLKCMLNGGCLDESVDHEQEVLMKTVRCG